jgi:hypothetical protein
VAAASAAAQAALVVGALAGIAIVVAMIARRFPKLGVVLWILVLCLAPYWFGLQLSFGPYFPPTALAALLLIFSATRIRAPQLTPWDFAVFVFGTIAVVAYWIGAETLAEAFIVVAVWIVPFIAGRVAASRVEISWIYGAIGVGFSVVAILAIIEFATGHNLFADLKVSNPEYGSWAPLQYRGGSLRAEGAFGHSIALGASLALAIPLVLASPFRVWIRTTMVLLILAAVVVTFSRVGMICAILSLVLSLLFLRDEVPRRLRVSLVVAGGIVAAGAYSLVITVFTAAGAEATDSASYRGDLTSLISQFNLVGLTNVFQKNAQGEVFFGDFHSIDSWLILVGLTYGSIALAVVIVVLLGALIMVLRRRATPATIALVAQIPAFATVALITQYASFVWFVGGLAVSTQLMLARANRLKAAEAAQAARQALVVASGRSRAISRPRIVSPARPLVPARPRAAHTIPNTSSPSRPRGTSHGTP